MVPYEFRCPTCGPQVVTKPMAEASRPESCSMCHQPMRRIYATQKVIVRPDGWNLRPGEYAGNGMGYSFFDYELERGQLKDDASGAYTPETRAKREAQIAAEDIYVPRPMDEIDRDIPASAHQELHEWARAVHSQIGEGA